MREREREREKIDGKIRGRHERRNLFPLFFSSSCPNSVKKHNQERHQRGVVFSVGRKCQGRDGQRALERFKKVREKRKKRGEDERERKENEKQKPMDSTSHTPVSLCFLLFYSSKREPLPISRKKARKKPDSSIKSGSFPGLLNQKVWLSSSRLICFVAISLLELSLLTCSPFPPSSSYRSLVLQVLLRLLFRLGEVALPP